MLKKDLAGFFAFFLGMFGVHRFYLGQWWRGAAQFVGFWGIIAILAEEGPQMPLPFILVGLILAPIITAIVFWATPYEKWAAKYDPEALQQQQQYQYQPALSSGSSTTGKASLSSLKAEGVKYYRSGDFDLAVEAFQEAVSLDPTDATANFNLACCFSLLGQYPDALNHLELACSYKLSKPERIETHPALKDLRQSDAYRTFRANNYRRLNLVELTQERAQPLREEVEEVLEDFEDPPLRSSAFQQRQEDEDLIQQITRLRELHNAGVLTEAEYKRQKEKLLG